MSSTLLFFSILSLISQERGEVSKQLCSAVPPAGLNHNIYHSFKLSSQSVKQHSSQCLHFSLTFPKKEQWRRRPSINLTGQYFTPCFTPEPQVHVHRTEPTFWQKDRVWSNRFVVYRNINTSWAKSVCLINMLPSPLLCLTSYINSKAGQTVH